MAALHRFPAASRDWTFSLHVFLYLQGLGLAEASPFVRALMHWGPLTGVLASKAVALGLGAVCVWRGRYQVIHLINCWYAALVIWDLALLTTR
jgi:hypothetical protein